MDDLLSRIRQRLYPETVPVLASYWLKTVYSAGHNLVWWSELNAGLEQVLREQSFSDTAAVEPLRNVQAWIRQEVLSKHRAPRARPRLAPPFRADLTSEQAIAYVCRLLNEWLPGEVAHLLTSEMEYLLPDDDGMPVLIIGKAVERLLYRERFSPETLELLLQPDLVCAYPAHTEILRDVVLALLGRTSAPVPPALPATLFAVAGGSALPPDFADAVKRAFLVPCADREELYVPLEEAQALDLLKREPVRIGSIVLTMDGRWWASEKLQGGAESAIVYRPGGRLRIDFKSDHAKLVVPWLDTEAYWPGDVRLPGHFEIFGREWRGVAWERNAEREWLHLEFSRALTIRDTEDDPNLRARHLRPASIEMAWSELEQVLASALSRRSTAPVDQLRREELIPLARAMLRLVDSVLRPSLQRRAEIERSLLSIRYHHGAVAPVYGRIPWRVLPAPVVDALRKRRLDAPLRDLLNDIFEDAPRAFSGPPRAA